MSIDKTVMTSAKLQETAEDVDARRWIAEIMNMDFELLRADRDLAFAWARARAAGIQIPEELDQKGRAAMTRFKVAFLEMRFDWRKTTGITT